MYSQPRLSAMSVLSCSGFMCEFRQYVPVYDALSMHDKGTPVRVVVVGGQYSEFYTTYNRALIVV